MVINMRNKEHWNKYQTNPIGLVKKEDDIPKPEYEQINLAYVDNGRTYTVFGKIKVNIEITESRQKPDPKGYDDYEFIKRNEDRIRTFVLECFPKKIPIEVLYKHIEQKIKSNNLSMNRYTIGYKRLIVYDIFAKNGKGWHHTFTEDKFSFTLRKDVIADNFGKDY